MSKSTKSLATFTTTTIDYAVEVLPRLDDNVVDELAETLDDESFPYLDDGLWLN